MLKQILEQGRKAIDAALERLYQAPEKFGRCEDTGKDIPFARLDLIPWARTCEHAEK